MLRIKHYRMVKKIARNGGVLTTERCKNSHMNQRDRGGNSVSNFEIDSDDNCSTSPLLQRTIRQQQNYVPVSLRDGVPDLMSEPTQQLMRIHSIPSNNSDTMIGECGLKTSDRISDSSDMYNPDKFIMITGNLSLRRGCEFNRPNSMDESCWFHDPKEDLEISCDESVVTKMHNTFDETKDMDYYDAPGVSGNNLAATEDEAIYEAVYDDYDSESVLSNMADDLEEDIYDSITNTFNNVVIEDSPSSIWMDSHQPDNSRHIESAHNFPHFSQDSDTSVNLAVLMTEQPPSRPLAVVSSLNAYPQQISVQGFNYLSLPQLTSQQYAAVPWADDEEKLVRAEDIVFEMMENSHQCAEFAATDEKEQVDGGDIIYENIKHLSVTKNLLRRSWITTQEQQQKQENLEFQLNNFTGNSPLDNEDYDYTLPINLLDKCSLSPSHPSHFVVGKSNVIFPNNSSAPSSPLLSNGTCNHAKQRSGAKEKSASYTSSITSQRSPPSSLFPSHVSSSVSFMHGVHRNPLGCLPNTDDPSSFLKNKAAKLFSVPAVMLSSSIRYHSSPLSSPPLSPVLHLSSSPVSPHPSSPLSQHSPTPCSRLPSTPIFPFPSGVLPPVPTGVFKMYVTHPPIQSAVPNLAGQGEGEAESEDYKFKDFDPSDTIDAVDNANSFYKQCHDSKRPTSPQDYECVDSATRKPLDKCASPFSKCSCDSNHQPYSLQYYTPQIQRKKKICMLVSSNLVSPCPESNPHLNHDPISMRPPALPPLVVTNKRPPASLPLEAACPSVTSAIPTTVIYHDRPPWAHPQSPVSFGDDKHSKAKNSNNGHWNPPLESGMSATPLSKVNVSHPLNLPPPSPRSPRHRSSEITSPSNLFMATHSENLPPPSPRSPRHRSSEITSPSNLFMATHSENLPPPSPRSPRHRSSEITSPSNLFMATHSENLPPPSPRSPRHRSSEITSPSNLFMATHSENLPPPPPRSPRYRSPEITPPSNLFIATHSENHPPPPPRSPRYRSPEITPPSNLFIATQSENLVHSPTRCPRYRSSEITPPSNLFIATHLENLAHSPLHSPHHCSSEITPPSNLFIATHSNNLPPVLRCRSSSNPLASPHSSSHAHHPLQPIPSTPSLYPLTRHVTPSESHNNSAGVSGMQVKNNNSYLAQFSLTSSPLNPIIFHPFSGDVNFAMQSSQPELQADRLEKPRTGSKKKLNYQQSNKKSASLHGQKKKSMFQFPPFVRNPSAKVLASQRSGEEIEVSEISLSSSLPETRQKTVPKWKKMFSSHSSKVRKSPFLCVCNAM